MTDIRNFDEANRVLGGFVPPDPRVRYNLNTMRKLMDALGNPQNSYKTIHVAGTSGKTSTSYYTAALLKAAGQKVGLTVSPHIDQVNERVQINLTPLPETEFCKELTEFLNILNKLSLNPSYFEVLIAFAYWEFKRQNVGYAVVEVGLGGLLDGTNVISNPQKVCLITDIGFDHLDKLGKTLPEITAQKAGIIQQGNTVIMHNQSQEIMDVVTKKCEKEQATLMVAGQKKHLAFNAMPYFQRRNWQLAHEVYNYMVGRDSLPELSESDLHATMRTVIPGRMEVIKQDNTTLVMDGSHNGQKTKAFVDCMQRTFPGQKAAILLSLKEDKEYQVVIPLLLPICSQLIMTTFDIIQDLPVKSINPDMLANAVRHLGFEHIQTIQDPIKAFEALQETKETVHVVTGSFYLLSCIRPLVKRATVVA